MREKLATLPLAQLREIAKENGIKSVTTMRKGDLVELLAGIYEEKNKKNSVAEPEVNTVDTKEGEARPELSSQTGEDYVEKSSYAREPQAERGSYVREPQPERGSYVRESQSDRGSYVRESQSDRGSYVRESQSDRGSYVRESQTERYSQARTQQPERTSYVRESQTERTYGEQPRTYQRSEDIQALDSGAPASGILEVMPDGFGFIRCENYMPGDDDVYVAPSQIRRFNLKTGDIITGVRRIKSNTEKFAALLYITSVNDEPPYVAEKRPNFEDLTPIFPNERLNLSESGSPVSLRITDLLSPIGKGQRGMIVSPPKAGKTTLLKQIARAITKNHKEMHIIILLIDERPEEVTDIKEYIEGPNVEVIYSTFDELPEHHRRVSEMVLERARRLVEHGRDVTILLDSITRLARAYNLLVDSSGRTLSGGLDPAALHMPKRFFGAARNMREGGSLTILATALVETGSRMDDVVYEEFKGTGNMEMVLNRRLSEKRIFPAIDIQRSGTRRDDLLLSKRELMAVDIIHKNTGDSKNDDSVERVLDLFKRTKSNDEFIDVLLKTKF